MSSKGKQPEKVKWWINGLIFGVFLYIINTLVFPLIDGQNLTPRNLLIGIPISIVFGLLYGLTERWIYKKWK